MKRKAPQDWFVNRDRRGAALVVILAFVVLLTGLVLAYFSYSALQRQISSASSNQTTVEIFTQGAISAIVSDFKQEIAAGSQSWTTNAGGVSVTNFYPASAAAAVPALSGFTTNAGLENLVKISRAGTNFFPSAYGNAASFPPSSRAAALSSTNSAQNDRSFSAARWNSSLLLAKQNTNSTTDFTPVAAFSPPDWILVNRCGGNPTNWNADLRWTGRPSDTNSVVGRYAYAIYDEGGLLDMNAAGFADFSAANLRAYAFKGGLGCANLTNVGLPSSAVETLVKWRNPAVTQSGNVTNYVNFMTRNPAGFMRVANTNLVAGRSDRMFVSRRQLLDFVSKYLGGSTNAQVQNALLYMGTFSRDVNQPSLNPLPAAGAGSTTTRPAITGAGAAGGNDAFGGDNIINPPFLNVRVQAGFTRNDGSMAVAGEPLVKRKFALSRLAWLTHKGPIANDAGNLSSDSEVQAIITTLRNEGFSDEFLKQGGPANVYKYFGLSWVNDPNVSGQNVWVYSHQGTSPLSSASPPAASIKTLGDGSNAVSGRDLDFFELLRAGINAGSIAKAAAVPDAASPEGYQAQKDVSSNAAIIQIGANLIDQFDGDGYPTRIFFNDGSWPASQEYRGVEDLPYFYRVRGSLMKLRESLPAFTAKTSDPPAGTLVPGNEGLGVALQQPEIWNPHTWNASAVPTSVRPTAFRLIAQTGLPGTVPGSVTMVTQPRNRYNTYNDVWPYADAPLSAPYNGSAVISPVSWQPSDTELLFEVPSGRQDLFREPTLLIKPGIPTGSNLRLGPQHSLKTNSTVSAFYSAMAGGLISLVQSPFYVSNSTTDNQCYIGMFMGTFPLAWQVTSSGTASICNAFLAGSAGGKPVTYRLQYEAPTGSGNWVTYDEKYARTSMNNAANAPVTSGARANWIEPSYLIGNDNGLAVLDPRTGRFGFAACAWQYNQSRQVFEWAPTFSSYGMPFDAVQKSGAASAPATYASGASSAASQNALWSLRPDTYSGFKAWPFPDTLGFLQNGMNGSTGGPQFRPGLLSQNNPSAGTGDTAVAGILGQGSTGTWNIFWDPDGVVRRGMAGFVQPTATQAERVPVAGAASGEPQAVATTFSGTSVTPNTTEAPSRPIMLNRPFRSVAEMGYASSGTPWRNLDFSSPESGSSGLLDVFCLSDSDDTNGLMAGKVNLNTRQPLVLRAILDRTCRDEHRLSSAFLLPVTGNGSANVIASELVRRTSDTAGSLGSGSGPLMNVSDLVGRWVAPVSALGGSWDGGKSYAGFSGLETTTTNAPQNPPNLSYIFQSDTSTMGYNTAVSQRYRESVVRALTASGQTRVWNLLIDIVAQTGRYTQSANSLDKFTVEGELRCWVHVAIDRFTGEVVDKQIEFVKE